MPRERIKTVRDSQVEMTEIVMPNDSNQLGHLFGGRLMQWLDICAAIAARRHSGRVCVTAAMDDLQFHHPISLGDIIVLHASVNRVFNTSMEIGVKVSVEHAPTGERQHTNTAYFTYVAVDDDLHPVPIPPIRPETQEEKRRYRDAGIRREMRLQKRKQPPK